MTNLATSATTRFFGLGPDGKPTEEQPKTEGCSSRDCPPIPRYGKPRTNIGHLRFSGEETDKPFVHGAEQAYFFRKVVHGAYH